jgi:integrase
VRKTEGNSASALEAALLQKKRRNTVEKIESLPKVMGFLDSIGRNSGSSKNSYSSGLSLLQGYLDSKAFQQRYQGKYNCDCETLLELLSEHKIDVYEFFNGYVAYVIATKPDIRPKSLSLYLTVIKSYFAFYDIDVIPLKFKRRVKIPKIYREDEEPIDAADIRKILLNCNNRRLKSYLLILASSGARAVEAASIRLKDIDFSATPTKIHLRPEFTRTRTARAIYISEEGTKFLNQWIEWKYRKKTESKDKGVTKIQNPDDLVFSTFSINEKPNPHNLYNKLLVEFQKLLTVSDLDDRKENGIHRRRKITLHSLRRHLYGVLSTQVSKDYADYFLGHANKSVYYTLKEPERREIYATKVMRYLTFLDYSALESAGKNIEDKLQEREREIYALKQREELTTSSMAALAEKLMKLDAKVELLEKGNNNNYNSNNKRNYSVR